MLHYHAILPETLELLKEIQQIDIFKHLRLVGGTSLALQIGHRLSDDIDLFGTINADRFEIINQLKNLGQLKTIRQSQNIHIFILNNVKIDIVNYNYPWIENQLVIDQIRFAGIKDIAAMKIAAITGRGTKKDFIDLYFLLKKFSIREILNLYQQKYQDGSLFLALKSLIYFDDADTDVMPKMFNTMNWNDIKQEISLQIKDFINNEDTKF